MLLCFVYPGYCLCRVSGHTSSAQLCGIYYKPQSQHHIFSHSQHQFIGANHIPGFRFLCLDQSSDRRGQHLATSFKITLRFQRHCEPQRTTWEHWFDLFIGGFFSLASWKFGCWPLHHTTLYSSDRDTLCYREFRCCTDNRTVFKIREHLVEFSWLSCLAYR